MIYITSSSAEEAEKLAKILVQERLLACANVFPKIRSFYWWEGNVQDENEAVLIGKTTEGQVENLTERVRVLHSYTCPCVVSLPIDSGNPAFLAWVSRETNKTP